MKKLITLFFLSALWTSVSFSQSNYPEWPQPGAKWTYCCADPGFSEQTAGESSFYYYRDTVINNETYQVIGNTPFSNAYITRFSNDTIYRYYNNQDHLLFYYDLTVGDSFPTVKGPAYWLNDTCNNIIYNKVYQMDLININGQNYKRWHISNISGYDLHEYIFIESIGFTSFHWGLHPLEFECELMASDGEHCSIGAYEDDLISHEFAVCPMADLKKFSEKSFVVYPNPAQNKVSITFPNQQEYAIKVTNLHGKEMLKKIHGNGNLTTGIDVSQLSSGVYLIIIENETGELIRKKFVKQ